MLQKLPRQSFLPIPSVSFTFISLGSLHGTQTGSCTLSFFLKGLNFPVISLSSPSSLLGLRSLRAPQNPICSPYHRIFCWGLSEGDMLMMRLGVFSRGQTMKGLFNHVKGLGLYPIGSQGSGKGFKPLKYHHLSDRQGRVLTGKWEGWAGETGKQIHRLGETNNNERLLADNVGALHSLLGSPPLTSCASVAPMTFLQGTTLRLLITSTSPPSQTARSIWEFTNHCVVVGRDSVKAQLHSWVGTSYAPESSCRIRLKYTFRRIFSWDHIFGSFSFLSCFPYFLTGFSWEHLLNKSFAHEFLISESSLKKPM